MRKSDFAKTKNLGKQALYNGGVHFIPNKKGVKSIWLERMKKNEEGEQ